MALVIDASGDSDFLMTNNTKKNTAISITKIN